MYVNYENRKRKIGARIKAEREKLGLSQKALLAKIYKSETSTKMIRAWERGEQLPDLESLARMAELFGCDIGYILGDFDDFRYREEKPLKELTGLSDLAAEELALAIGEHRDGRIDAKRDRANHNLEVGRFCKFSLLQSILESAEERDQSIWEQLSVYAHDYLWYVELQKKQPNTDKYGRSNQYYANMYIEDAKAALDRFFREDLKAEDFDLGHIEITNQSKKDEDSSHSSSYYDNFPVHNLDRDYIVLKPNTSSSTAQGTGQDNLSL